MIANSSSIFSTIYERNQWGNGSGSGSTPNATVEYRKFLIDFLETHKIHSILDIGCGDWQFSKTIDFSQYDYTGIDCVEFLIETNNRLYSQQNIRFIQLDVLKDNEIKDNILLENKKYDLIILKDVIQHWSNHYIDKVLPILRKKAKFLLVTNSSYQKMDNEDTEVGGFRPLSHLMEPLLKFEPQLLLSYFSHYVLLFGYNPKEIVLIEGM